MSSWLWGTPETDISYEEISTPTTDEEIKAVGEAAIKELLQAFSTDEGWTEFPFTEVERTFDCSISPMTLGL